MIADRATTAGLQRAARTREIATENDSGCISSPFYESAQTVRIPDVTGLSPFKAARAYADTGIYVLPIDPAKPKNPGSIVGRGWPTKSIRDSDEIEARWNQSNPPGIAIHTGRSGLVVFDLDEDVLPDELAWMQSGLFQSSRIGESQQGHYVFASAEVFVAGKLMLSDGTQVGEIRSGNSVILAEPSAHAKADQGGRYQWQAHGEVPELPETARRYLTTRAGELSANAADDDQVTAFISQTEHSNDRPKALTALVGKVANAESGTRDWVRNVLRVAAGESRVGLYPFTRAISEIETAARQSYDKRGENYEHHIGAAEYSRLVANAVGLALARDVDELRAEANRDYGDKAAENAALVDGFATHTESDDVLPSWSPVDMATALAGTAELTTTILARTDGVRLFYPGKVHSVHGESESGKTWLALCAVAECLTAGEPVLYVDFEDDAKGVGGRLLLMGVPRATVTDPRLFAYVRPEAGLVTEAERNAFAQLLSEMYSLAVLDGVTESMGLFGLIGKDNDNVATWQRQLPNAIARSTGAAVVCIDHVTKDADSRGRFAIGGQQKMAGLSGAAFIIEPVTPFARGLAGEASVRVGKDRPGFLRGMGGDWRPSDRTQLVAMFALDSTDPGRILWKLDPPSDQNASGGQSNADSTRRKWCMEQVSRYWEEKNPHANTDPKSPELAACSSAKTEKAMLHAHSGSGFSRDMWRAAISALVVQSYAKHVAGPRKSKLHIVARQYRESDDDTPDGATVNFTTVSQAKYVGDDDGDSDDGIGQKPGENA